MKCPKCGYLGFETSDRCRNCGYEFSLSVDIDSAAELPLHREDAPAGGPLGDFDLAIPDDAVSHGSTADLDLDRIIGTPSSETRASAPTRSTPSRPPGRDERGERPAARRGSSSSNELPLFGAGGDDTPLITTPRPPRAPLAVRRTTPEIPRTRPRRTVTPSREGVGLTALQTDHAGDEDSQVGHEMKPARRAVRESGHSVSSAGRTAAVAPRLIAAMFDTTLLAAIDAAVVYLTLALAGLTWEEYRVLPLAPLVGFLAILNGGYLTAFVAASGQTIGKMLTGVRVVGEDGRRVAVAAAVLRAAGCGVSLLTAGAGYLPFFFTSDRRAVQDRIAGTRVISAR